MKFWQSAEWQRISKLRGLKLLLVGIAVIPSIYAVIFLSSLWDTYGKIDNLPVAVVNNDQAADINGKTQHLGQDLTDKLLREKPLKLSEVSSQKAKDGLKSGKYYMTITIPSDFTNNAGTLLSNDPKYAKIDIAQNAGQSFIAEKMTSSAADKIKASVNRSLQQVYNETILSATKSSQKGFQAGADGATQLNNGLGQLADGSQKLNDGAQALTNGSSTLAGGLSQYTNGVSQANTGSNQLSNGAGAAATGANQLASGTSQLAQNAPKLAAGSQQLASGAQELARKLQEVSDGITTGQTNGAAQIKQLEVGLATLTQQVNNIQLPENAIDSNGLTQNSVNLKEGLEGATIDTKKIEGLMDAYNLKETNPKLAEQLVGIVRDLEGNIQKTSESAVALSKLQALIPQLDAFKKQLPQLKAGMSAAQAGNQQAITKLNGSLTQVSQLLSQQFVPAANQLASGAEQLNNGQQQVSSASAQLNNGANKLADGNAQLANGVNQLNGGLGQLVAKNGELNAGAGQLNQGAQQLTTGTQQAVSALGQAQNGTQTLAQKLADGAIKLDKVHNDKANVSALTQPVKSNQTNLSEVDNNGTGMTPYMMSVGLFVGMITFSAIYDFVTVAKRPKNGFAWWADKQTVNMPVWIA